ncbi:hypothetical protein BAE30_03260 [Acidithiobacillus caldus]|uniref:Uncharacterized protein n=1 Tax=Acidithiobacillus caldus TaxID=33059 RepID=A0A1E7Z057_9PROT|nr:hypothetical protein BAE30_03260 [Acidithiobacillus caldus]
MTERLSNMHFMALRSLAKEPWYIKPWLPGRKMQWKINKQWCYIYDLDDTIFPMDKEGCHLYHGDPSLWDRAFDACRDLVSMGFAEEELIHVGPDPDCHIQDRLEYRLTERGRNFLERVSAKKKDCTILEAEQPAMPKGMGIGKVWFRWTEKAKGWLSRF